MIDCSRAEDNVLGGYENFEVWGQPGRGGSLGVDRIPLCLPSLPCWIKIPPPRPLQPWNKNKSTSFELFLQVFWSQQKENQHISYFSCCCEKYPRKSNQERSHHSQSWWEATGGGASGNLVILKLHSGSRMTDATDQFTFFFLCCSWTQAHEMLLPIGRVDLLTSINSMHKVHHKAFPGVCPLGNSRSCQIDNQY